MKRFLFGFVLGVLLSNAYGVKAQETVAVEPQHVEHDLTVKEIVETMADFDVLHREQQPFYRAAYGVTSFDSSPPTMWIFSAQDFSTKESTIIHELIHIRCHKLGVDCSEGYVASEETRQYQKFFVGVQ